MLATIADLAAIGAIPNNESTTSERYARAVRLLELASAQVVAYLRLDDEAAFLEAYTASQVTAVSAIVAEAAGQRLNATAAPSSEYIPDMASAILNRRHWRAVDKMLGRAGRGSRTITAERDVDTSFLTVSQAGIDQVPL